jgi:L-ascorbate metabolism protein UlaG (beta-lactamase superfamily)
MTPFTGLRSWSREVPTAPEAGTYLRNEKLTTIKKGHAGNPFREGRFYGEYDSGAGKSVLKIIKWKLSRNPRAEEKRTDSFALNVIQHNHLPGETGDYIMWLGHASFLIRINGRSIITDPCLTQPPLIPRHSSLPLPIDKFEADYLLISHGHYDHLDTDTLRLLPASRTRALVPLKMGSIIKNANADIQVEEAGWYQRYTVNDDLEIFLLPAYHWHKRALFDLNAVLWGSYLIRWKDQTIYFAGDSGFSTHFAEIGKLFGKIDYAILPIGSYEPSYIMKMSHMNPQEAVRAFHDLNARVFIPMHYGTFDLTDEPLGDPVHRLRKIMEQGKVKGDVWIPDVGAIQSLA